MAVDIYPKVDISDRNDRLLGIVSISSGNITTTVSEITQVGNVASGTVAVANFPTTYDISDRVGRLVGIVSVSSGSIVVTSGSVNVANLPSTYDVSDRADRILGNVVVTSGVVATTGGGVSAILKGSLFNTSVAANTNFFGSNLSPTNSPVIFRTYIAMNTAGVLSVRRTQGATTVSEQLNGGASLIANASYIFDVIVTTGQTINFQYSTGATVLSCIVIETSA